MRQRNSTDLCDLYVTVKNDISKILSSQRYEHSVETAKLAQAMCLQYNVQSEKGQVAGIAHDIAREYSNKKLLDIVDKMQLKVTEWEIMQPAVLHGYVGAWILQTHYFLQDTEILDAVRAHVIGAENMGILSKILFAADYCEPTRPFLAETERNELLAMPLDLMIIRIFEKIFYFLEKKALPISPVSIAVYNKLVLKGTRE